MKNKRIRGDWYYILTVMYSVLTLFLIFLVVMSVYIQIYGLAIISAILLLASIIAVFINNSLGFNIQYKKGKIRYIGYGTEIKSIKIEEIDHVELQEAYAERKKIYLWDFFDILFVTGNHAWGSRPRYVYRNGKIYYISVFKKNGEIVKYDFNALYKVSSRKNIIKAEAKINKILDELNEYIAKTDKYWQKMHENFG